MATAAKKNTMARLAVLLQKATKSKKVSVAQIVERTGIHRSLVYKYMAGTQEGCTVDTLERLTKAIGAHPADVFPKKKGAPKKK